MNTFFGICVQKRANQLLYPYPKELGYITIASKTTTTAMATTMWMKSFMNMLKLLHFNRFKSNFPQYSVRAKGKKLPTVSGRRKYEKVLMRCRCFSTPSFCLSDVRFKFSIKKKFLFRCSSHHWKKKRKRKGFSAEFLDDLSIHCVFCMKISIHSQFSVERESPRWKCERE